jgi:hypothetical protein
MDTVKRRYSKKEFAKRGDAMYEKEVRPQLKPSDKGKFAAIDVESGAFEVSRSELTAVKKLSKRLPESQIWIVRVGYRTTHRI